MLLEASHGRWSVLSATLSTTTQKSVLAKWMVDQVVYVGDHSGEDKGFDAEDHLSKDEEFVVERKVEDNIGGTNTFW